MNHFATDHLTPAQRKIAEVILSVLPPDPKGSGANAFWSPKAWKERGEQYGINAELVLVHESSDLAPYCNFDYQQYDKMDKMVEALQKIGVYVEACTGWYSAVYKIKM